MIRFENASVTYPGGVSAMKDLSIEIDEGEFVVIVGLSGAGKSTLIRAVNGLVPLTSGTLQVNGREVTELNRAGMRELRSEVGMIFQGFNLVERTTVLNNVLMGRLHRVPTWRTLLGMYPKADIDIAARALGQVEIIEKAYTRASDLSGGQRQRVGIARALAQEPSIVLADEPVASLDPPTSHVVMRYLQQISRDLGITTIVNLHFLDLATAYADRIIGLRDGAVGFRRARQRVRRAGVRGHLRSQPHRRRHHAQAGRLVTMPADRHRQRPNLPPKPRPSLFAIGGTLAAIVMTIVTARSVGFSFSGIVTNLGRKNSVIEGLLSPDWGQIWSRRSRGPFIETFQLAVLGTVTGSSLSLPLALWSTKFGNPNPFTRGILRSFNNVIRSIPDLLWALLFVSAVGIGALPGLLALFFFSLAVTTKLTSDTLDGIDMGPIEAANAAGANLSQMLRTAVVPQILPAYSSFVLYNFEINLRASAVLGLVGAGGIGNRIEFFRGRGEWEQLWGLVFMFFLVVFFVERLSVTLRRRLI